MKVLFLLEDLCFGGTQRQNLELALRLNRARFDPVILTLTGERDLDDIAAQGGVPVSHLGKGHKAAPFFFARLGGAIRRLSPDVIIPCTAMPNIWGRLWGKALNIPVLGTVRGGGSPKRQHERFLWPLAAHIVCNSRPLMDAMLKLGAPRNRLTFIPNGVDVERFAEAPVPPSARKPLIVCVARLARDKDHETLLLAFSKVAQKNPDVLLRLVGDGPEEERLRRLAESLKPDIARRIEFAGAALEPAPHYREARVFALASIREGTPNVVMEAMASGTPVCASNVGGIPDITDGAALLFPARDSEALAAALARLLEDGELADSLAKKGREAIASKYSFAAMTRAHEDILQKLHGTSL